MTPSYASSSNRWVSLSSQRPAACPRDPGSQCQSEISGSRGQAAGRRQDCLACDIEKIPSYYRKITNLIRVLLLLFPCCFLTGCIDLAVNQSRHLQASLKLTRYAKGEIYTMRGGLGGIFSKGMNHLEDTLAEDYHVHAYSTVWFKAKGLSDSLIKRYKAKQLQGPIILVGHSLGANDQIAVARNLARANIPVALLITIDAVLPFRIPSNVQQALNIYKPSFVPMFSGFSLNAADPKLTHVENLNVNKVKGIAVNHFTIDKDSYVQRLMLDRILATLKAANKSL